MDAPGPESWLLLVVSLPTPSATARMRIWRALKSLGCMALRDGAYLLPSSADREQALRELADECVREHGSAWLMSVQPRSADDADAYRALFDRSDDYAGLRSAWTTAGRTLASLSGAELTRLQRKLRRDYDAVRSVDFFPGEASTEAEARWIDFNRRIEAILSPDEPQAGAGRIARLDPEKYQSRTWATRRRPWVDRLASAWLIRRFIDREARFCWLATPSECPGDAVGFDFDGAAFTHVGDCVTFETLMASFDLQGDAALRRMAAIVHALDVGGDTVPEARGLEVVLSGARGRLADDDALFAETSTVFDSFYAHFQRESRRGEDTGDAR